MSWSSKCPEGPWYPRVSRVLVRRRVQGAEMTQRREIRFVVRTNGKSSSFSISDRLEEINLRVGRLQEASSVTARKSGEILLTEGKTFSNAFIVAFKDIDRRSVERSRGTNALPVTSPPPRRNAASDYSVSRHPGFDGRRVHFRESAFRDNYAAPKHPVGGSHTTSGDRGFQRYNRNDALNFHGESRI
ncbi:hypothetical protein TNCV_2521491 [Trichonephila clavipes]|nr:hypothetical protein TNCV_2521491 [Trichonephila clavipes]